MIKPSDLINEKDFLMHLLEWFNFEDWAMESQVLGLLCQLSEVRMHTCPTIKHSTIFALFFCLLLWQCTKMFLVKGGLYNLLNSTLISISLLLQHEEAANTLVELGGVEFLSQLRLHCDPSLHFFIDETLEHLLKLPHHLFPTAGPSSPLPHTSMNLPLPHTGMHLSTKSLTTEQLGMWI